MDVPKLPHHDQKDLCKTRAPYRQGRKLTAVKVYTISDESVYLLVTKVPDIKLEKEITGLCQKFGIVEKVENLPNYPHDDFETTYVVKYRSVRFSRKAKRALDGRNFFGGVLHVCYAPELEMTDETRNKLRERKSSYLFFQSKYLQKERKGQMSRCKKFFIQDLKHRNINQYEGDFPNNLPSISGMNFPVGLPKEAELLNTQKSSLLNTEGNINTGESYLVSDYNKNDSMLLNTNEHLKLYNKKRLISNNFRSCKSVKNSKSRVHKISQPPMTDLQRPINANIK